jgi:hypothetical protein
MVELSLRPGSSCPMRLHNRLAISVDLRLCFLAALSCALCPPSPMPYPEAKVYTNFPVLPRWWWSADRTHPLTPSRYLVFLW